MLSGKNQTKQKSKHLHKWTLQIVKPGIFENPSSSYWLPQLVSIEDLYRAKEFSKRWNLVSIEGVYRTTSRKVLKEIRWKKNEKDLVNYKGLMPFISGGVPMFELLGTQTREISKKWNLVSIEDTHRATGRNILKEIRRENFEKSIVEKGSLLHTNHYIQTGT